MYDIIEKLLILQDRDRRIMQVREQLARIGPERETLHAQTGAVLAALDAAKARGKQTESERKQRELEVEGKNQQIGRYSLQQFQTKKNEEYRALAHEIETCRADIARLEDAQLELMEQAEATQREITAASRQAEELKKMADGQLKELADREQSLTAELAELESNRDQIKSAVDALLKALGRSPADLNSVLGRHAARALECKFVADQCIQWLDQATPDAPTFADFTIPESGRGHGLTEAARGALGHWLDISDSKIRNYQCVVPTTWNCSPRDDRGIPGTVEQALVGLPVADPQNPIEAARVVRSFDPCLACAVH